MAEFRLPSRLRRLRRQSRCAIATFATTAANYWRVWSIRSAIRTSALNPPRATVHAWPIALRHPHPLHWGSMSARSPRSIAIALKPRICPRHLENIFRTIAQEGVALGAYRSAPCSFTIPHGARHHSPLLFRRGLKNLRYDLDQEDSAVTVSARSLRDRAGEFVMTPLGQPRLPNSEAW